MTRKAVYGIVLDHDLAQSAVKDLERAGFAAPDISALFNDEKATKDFARGLKTTCPSAGVTGMGIPEPEAGQYARSLRDGSVLISVLAEEGDDVERALQAFKTFSASLIGSDAASTSVWPSGASPPTVPAARPSSPPASLHAPPPRYE